MFGKKQQGQQRVAIKTLIGPGTRVHGDVEFEGGCLVDGFVKGNVKSVDDENATLTISERGSVEGSVRVPNVVLNGTVRGDVSATNRVELGSKARVIGNVQYRLVEMAIGAEVNGKLIHESEGAADKQSVAEDRQSGEPEAPAQPVRSMNVVGE